MEKVLTKDGSMTLHNAQYNETYHSVSGALEEAFEKFARPCRLKDGMKILDICFGLGYNSLAAISLADVEIVALENDPTILNQIKGIKMPISQKSKISGNLENLKNFQSNYEFNNKTKNIETPEKNYPTSEMLKKNYEKIRIAAENLNYADDKIRLGIIIGGARETIKKLNEKFDAVFLDPFSPKKCPELWTREFFEDIRKLMRQNSVLATYSCAGFVRNNLVNAGFDVKDGPSIGRRAPSTIAYAL